MKMFIRSICLMLLVGCDRGIHREKPAGPDELEIGFEFARPTDPGRFTESAVKRSIAPWDGSALMLILSEHPLIEARPDVPRISIGIYHDALQLSGRRIRLFGNEMKEGVAHWIDTENRMIRLDWADIEFDAIRDGNPVAGIYAVAMPDGTIARGRFLAKWWTSDGPGG